MKFLDKEGVGESYSKKVKAIFGYSNRSKYKSQSFNNNSDVLSGLNIFISQQILHMSTYLDLFIYLRDLNIALKTYKGVRYLKNLPARGQRTHTNAQTVRKINKLKLEKNAIK